MIPNLNSEQLDFIIQEYAKAIEKKMIVWRRDLHKHPELAMQEYRTSSIVSEHLKSLNFDEVREGLGGGTGVVGILRGNKPGPVVALRADMDALPIKEETAVPFASKVKAQWGEEEVPVMHACGHDAHTSILMAASEVFAKLRENLEGTIMVIFQPAEEGPPPGWENPNGAELMLKEGIFNDPKPDVLFGLHVVGNEKRGTCGSISYHEGVSSYCMDRFTITVKGKSAHASTPWQGVDALLAGAQIVSALHTLPSRNVDVRDNEATIAIGTFDGGVQHNVVADEVVMKGALRITDASSRLAMERRVEEISSNIAESVGANATVQWTAWVPQIKNDLSLIKQLRPSFIKATGDTNKVINAEPAFLDDVSHFTDIIPSIFFFVSAAQDEGDTRVIDGHHSPLFWINEKSLLPGMKALLHMTFDYMKNHNHSHNNQGVTITAEKKVK